MPIPSQPVLNEVFNQCSTPDSRLLADMTVDTVLYACTMYTYGSIIVVTVSVSFSTVFSGAYFCTEKHRCFWWCRARISLKFIFGQWSC